MGIYFGAQKSIHVWPLNNLIALVMGHSQIGLVCTPKEQVTLMGCYPQVESKNFK
jgi:hypothetical protein